MAARKAIKKEQVTPEGAEHTIEVEGKFLYIRKIEGAKYREYLSEMLYAGSDIPKMIAVGEKMILENWVQGSDDAFRTDQEYIPGAARQVVSLIKLKVGSIKKN
jgi:hypothetical protein